MALWSPKSTDPVGPNERIGRRLFDQKQLSGAQDQKRPPNVFELYHFEERRDAGDISVDRLGKTGIDRRVCNYVERRAIFAASSFKPARKFIGWAVVSAKALQRPAQGPSLLVTPSPLIASDENELLENKYHAHIERPSRYQPYEMAMHLKTIFERNYHFEAGSTRPPTATDAKPLHVKFLDWMKRKFRELRKNPPVSGPSGR